MVNSRNKGATGEREFARLCKKHGFTNARRGQQYSGLEGEDVVVLPSIHFEVKRVERLNLDKAFEQANRDAKVGQVPLVAHRKNGGKWLITCEAEWLLNLLRGVKSV